ncbi:conjugal transfer protein TrbL family protein [Exiguobacterium sp. BG5(2022)]|uniref:conjugal transfer protein TrbL family protein n=1 Tax=Exiguobacterium sp. BG5(2022) TaxID=2962595 RepID=UPI0028819907|nr:conjugal transfer protein TrbL family protein [Exiguobacterium sp. BG5(2022)]MDT0193676.1 hypothetical protein [Exiguobacterium sp. BG5(2022)]
MNGINKILISLLCILVLFGSIPNFTYADEGDFYERNKDAFKSYENVLGEQYIEEIVKKYDYETNSFNCGKLNFTCHALSVFYPSIIGITNIVGEQIQLLVRDPDKITKDEGLKKYKGYLTSLSYLLLPLFLMWHMMVMALRRLGDPDDYQQAMNQKLLGVFAGAAFLGLYNQIFDIIITLQNDMLNGIVKDAANRESMAVMLFTWGPKHSVIVLLFVIIAMFVFGLALMYRFVALSFMFMVGPLAISTILNDEFNYFSIWWKYIINNMVTFILQAIAYAYCMQVLTNQNSYVRSFPLLTQPTVAISMTLVITFFALTIPSLLGNLGNSTGTGRSMGRVAKVIMMRR